MVEEILKECVGECPNCGAKIEKYGKPYFIESGIINVPFKCRKCKAKGAETHRLNYMITDAYAKKK